MRILADENVPRAAVQALRDNGHDVLWARTEAPGEADVALLTRAQREGRVVVTFDKDFGELSFRTAADAGAGIVLFRLQPASPGDVATTLVSVLESRADWSGLFAVVEPGRVRIISVQP